MLFDPCTLLSMCSLFRIHRAFQMPKLFTFDLARSLPRRFFISSLSIYLYLFSLIFLFHFFRPPHISIYLLFACTHANAKTRKRKLVFALFSNSTYFVSSFTIFSLSYFLVFRNPSSLVFRYFHAWCDGDGNGYGGK